MIDLTDLPTGTVTFLFTDLEGSTRLLQAHPAAYREAVRRHHDLLRGAVEAHQGVVFETVGDAVYAAFAHATDAVAAALAGQQALHQESWGEVGSLRARMGVHLGEVEAQGGHYFGAPLYRCARLTAAAHGGQVVLSQATVDLVQDALPAGAGLRDLGEHRLKDLQRPERVVQLTAPDLPADFPPLRSLDARPHNLPLQLTSFVGRERELADVAGRLAAHRLVTLTGPGGTGKTRLALQAAAELLGEYPDGAWLVELAALADPALVPQAVAAAVGVREEPGRPLLATLTDALRPKRLLLVLDNCEHLLDACARLVDPLLHTCPGVQVVATSREALGIAAEAPYRVPSLAVPKGPAALPLATLTRSEAATLFVDRASTVQSHFGLTEQNAATVAEICARLDGIPLAIELAAARVRVLPPVQLLGRLEDRFRLLTGGSRTALARHQTLKAAVDWSYDLLQEPERRLFNRLSVFVGGWTLEAAEAVCAGEGLESDDVLELLTRLVDQSLVAVEEQPDGTARYRLLETLRQYGRQNLGTSAAATPVHAGHTAYYLALAEQAALGLRGAAQVAWLHRLETERDDLRAALGWLISSAQAVPPAHGAHAAADAATQALRLAAAQWLFWHKRGADVEGLQWMETCLALPGAAARTVARAKALAAASLLLLNQGAPGRLRDFAEEALAIAQEQGDQSGTAFALVCLGYATYVRVCLGYATYVQGDLAASVAAFDAALAPARDTGDQWSMTYALWGRGTALIDRDDAAAQRDLEQSLALARRLGDQFRIAQCLHNLAILAHKRGAHATFRALVDECLALQRALGDPEGIAWALAQAAQLEGDQPAERALLERSLAVRRDIGHRRQVPPAARRLAQIALEGGDHLAARRLLEESIHVWPHQLNQGVAASLAGFAALALTQGQPERALRLAGAAQGLLHASGAALPPSAQLQQASGHAAEEPIDRVRDLASQLLAADVHARTWAAGQAMPVEQAVAYALEDAPDAA